MKNSLKNKDIKFQNLEQRKKQVSFLKIQCELSTKGDKLIFALALVSSILYAFFNRLLNIIMGLALTNLTLKDSKEDFLLNMSHYCLYYLYASILIFITSFFSTFFWILNGNKLTTIIKKEYFKIIMLQEQSWFDQQNPHEITSKVNLQTNLMEDGLGMKVGHFTISLSMTILGMIMAFITNWKLSLVLMSLFPIMALCSIYWTNLNKKSSKENLEAFQNAGGIAEEILYNIKTVASFCNFDHEIERFNLKLKDSFKNGLARSVKVALSYSFIYATLMIYYALAAFYSPKIIIQGETNYMTGKVLKGGDIYIIVDLIIFSGYYLGESLPFFRAISDACFASEEFFALREKNSRKIQTNNISFKPNKDSIEGKITFRNVSFSYPSNPDKMIIDKLSVEFESGKTTAIVGASGNGKTTIISLIERLYEIESGDILIDDINIKNIDLEYMRSLIGYVGQEPILFNTSIRDNIIFGRENITEHQIQLACSKANVTEFLNKLDNGLETIAGIKGGKLSGGQKQRIAIARAILTKPKFLILDEATSALDNKCEKEVKEALQSVSEGITTIIIAHRLSTVIHADKICVLNEGKIVEMGSHKELIEKKGLYNSLVRREEIYQDRNTRKLNYGTEDNSDRIKMIDHSVTLLENSLVTNDTHINDTNKLLSVRSTQKHINSESQKSSKALKNKEQIEQYASLNKNKLWIMISHKKILVFTAIISSALVGILFPTYGTLIANSIELLSYTDKNVMEKAGFILSMYFLLVACLYGIGYFLQNYSYEAIGENLAKGLRALTFIKYLRLDVGFYDNPENTPGSMLGYLTNDTANLNAIILSQIGVLIQCFFTLTFGLTLSFMFDWRIALIKLISIPFVVISNALFISRKLGNEADKNILDSARNVLSESVINTKSIFSYNMQSKMVKIYSNIIDQVNINEKIKIAKSSVFLAFSQFSNYSANSIILWVAAIFISNGSLTLGNMVRAYFCIYTTAWGLATSFKNIEGLGKAKESLHKIFTMLDIPSTIDPLKENPTGLKPHRETVLGKIEFRNVSFSYPTSRNQKVFNNLNFTINPSQSVAFVGLSGSGKSTIFQLLERFYDVNDGQILIDDVNIKSYDIISLRNMISLVQQEPVLFRTTIADNIKYGKLDATDEQIRIAAEKSKISSKLYGDNVNISGGEKQRVAIARAIIRDPRILLLDEATSSLDKKVEEEIQESLNGIMKGRTSIMIAHRLTTVEKCDNIFVMEDGMIVEQGNHEQLLSMKGRYYELYNAGI